MKVLIICIIFEITVCLVSAKSINKRDCCSTTCSFSCNSGYTNCNNRPCNSGYSNCNSRPCNSGNSNCNSRPCNPDCNSGSCNNRPNCDQKNNPCNDNSEEEPIPEVLPILVPFPQNPSALPIPATINNTNINNSTLEFTMTNSINSVNNISVPISINSTNQNSIAIHLEKTKEYDQVDQSIEEIDQTQCCYVIGKKCDANNLCTTERRKECSDICKGILPEVNLPQPTIQSTISPDTIQPIVNKTTVYQPTEDFIRYFYQQPPIQRFPILPYPPQQFPFQPLPPAIQPSCSINSGSPCSQSPRAQLVSPFSIQPSNQPQPQILIQPQSPSSVYPRTIQPGARNTTVYQPPVNYGLFYQPTANQQSPFQPSPVIQSPCSINPGSPCSQPRSLFQSLYPISFQPQIQHFIQQQQQPQQTFIQPPIQPTVINCGRQAQQTMQQLLFPNYPVSPCGQLNLQPQPSVPLPVEQPKSNFNGYYLNGPPCSYQNPPLNPLYFKCPLPDINQVPFYQQNVPVQHDGSRESQQQLENQSAFLRSVLLSLQQQQEKPPFMQNQ